MEIKPGLCGLANLGNTCYMNSCLQILSHTPQFTASIFANKENQRYKKISILKEWMDLYTLLWSNPTVVSPKRFLVTIQIIARKRGYEEFTGNDQNDFVEFFMFFMNLLHDDLSRKVEMSITGSIETEKDSLAVLCYKKLRDMYETNYSEILKTFYGIHASELHSSDAKIVSKVAEPFIVLSLPIPKNTGKISLFNCLDLFVSPEKLSNENKWFNETTKEYEEVVKKTIFFNFPNILVISFKRFNNTNKKINHVIDFPIENLNLSDYIHGYKQDTFVYDLYGIANHSGSVTGGHYTSYVKVGGELWYHFDDACVTEINKTLLVSSRAYCLFYQKRGKKS